MEKVLVFSKEKRTSKRSTRIVAQCNRRNLLWIWLTHLNLVMMSDLYVYVLHHQLLHRDFSDVSSIYDKNILKIGYEGITL